MCIRDSACSVEERLHVLGIVLQGVGERRLVGDAELRTGAAEINAHVRELLNRSREAGDGIEHDAAQFRREIRHVVIAGKRRGRDIAAAVGGRERLRVDVTLQRVVGADEVVDRCV